MKQKKVYAKPAAVFEDFVSGELRGDPKAIKEIMTDCEGYEQKVSAETCSLDTICFPCVETAG